MAIGMQRGDAAPISLLECRHIAAWLKGEHPIKFNKSRFTRHVFPLCMRNEAGSDARQDRAA